MVTAYLPQSLDILGGRIRRIVRAFLDLKIERLALVVESQLARVLVQIEHVVKLFGRHVFQVTAHIKPSSLSLLEIKSQFFNLPGNLDELVILRLCTEAME